MRAGNILFSAVHFFVIFFILTVGVLFLTLPYTEHLRILLINSLLNNHAFYQTLGYVLIGGGALLLIGLYMMNRRRFFQIEMQASKIEVDESLIQEVVANYWKERFSDHESNAAVIVKGKQSIEIMATLPEEKEEDFFEEVQKELGSLLARQFGYQKPFVLTLVETSR